MYKIIQKRRWLLGLSLLVLIPGLYGLARHLWLVGVRKSEIETHV